MPVLYFSSRRLHIDTLSSDKNEFMFSIMRTIPNVRQNIGGLFLKAIRLEIHFWNSARDGQFVSSLIHMPVFMAFHLGKA
jgi:hypothetical protein